MKHLMAVARATLVLAALASAHPALAAPTFTVNDAADDLVDVNPGNGICSTTTTTPYICTLRAAFMEANHTTGAGATIVIPAGTYTLGISAAGSDDETSGDLNLTTPASGNPIITITGAGAATTIIDANQIDRVLHVHAGRTVSITGVKIRNGYTANDGGGIWNEGTLTLTGCTIGGSDLEANAAHSGGGIKNDVNAQLNVDSSTFSSNFAAVGNPNDSGGGLFNLGAANLSKSTFNGNYAIIYGGGIYSSAAAILYLDQSLVNDNSGQFGSGIGNAGTMHVTTSTISANYFDVLGGGVYNTGTLDISGSTISDNGTKAVQSGDLGGGIYNAGSLVLGASTISGNAAHDGAGINNSNALFLTDSTISGNSALSTGGGIANNSSSGVANVYNTTIVFNVAGAADSGGGVYNDNVGGAKFALRNSLLANNYVPSMGLSNDCRGTMNSYGRNLIGTSTMLPANCSVVVWTGSSTYLNPANSLGPLQNNGGPTATHALLPGSNAIDGGDPAPPGCVDQNSALLLTDQRGFPRTDGAVCDIGAFEYVDRIFKNGFQ